MATKKSSKTMTPAVRHLRYELQNSGDPGTETSHYIDLARDLSIVNRRLYRQGRDYHVKKITVVSSNTPNLGNRVSASGISSSWVAHNAWRRGFEVWTKMDKEASENLSGNIRGTWSDFKIYLSNDMRSGNVLEPMDNGGNAYLPGEWVYTRLVSPDGTTSSDAFYLHMLGDHQGSPGSWSAIGLVKSYGQSRATVQGADPNVPGVASDDPIVNVFDYGTTVDEVVNLMEGDNDTPPYDLYDYPGQGGNDNGPKPAVFQDTTLVDGRAVMGGFNALCGLIELETTSTVANDVFSVLVELAPGKYRGINADVI